MIGPGKPSGELLDRERALRELRALIDESCARGEPAIVRVTGQPGIGKSTFLRHAATLYAGNGSWLWAGAEPAGRTLPGACIQAALAAAAPARGDENALRAALDTVLTEHAALCIDDVQWLDEVSARIVRGVVRGPGAPSIVLFGDRRDEAPELPAHRTIRLAPLRTSAATRLVRRWYANAPEEVVGEIVSTASGIPFSIEYLALEASRHAVRSRHEIDASVASAIVARLARAGVQEREALKHAAFLESPADLRVIARALGGDLAAAAHALTEFADLVAVDDLRVTFRHAVIAEGVRHAVSEPVPYFARLLRALETNDDGSETLAEVIRCARGCGDDERVAASALRLARILASSGSLVTALDYLVLARRHAPKPLPSAYALEYAGVLQQLARDDAAAEFLRAELRGAIERGDAHTAADLLTSYSSVALTLERFAELDALAERVSALAAARDPSALPIVRTAQLAGSAFTGRLDTFAGLAASAALRWNDHRLVAFAESLRGEANAAREAFERYQAALRPQQMRMTPSDHALGAMLGLFSVGNAALVAADASWPDDAVGGAYVTGTALRILSRLNDGRWNEADAIVARLPLHEETYDESYTVLDARLMYTALAQRTPVAPERTLQALRMLIARGRRRHAIATACWYWIACERSGATVPADIASFVADAVDTTPMPYLLGGIPLAVAWLAPQLGVARCLQSLDRRCRFGSRWHRAHDDLARALLTQDHEHLRRARDAFDELDAPVFAMIAGLALPVPRASDAALARALGVSGGTGTGTAPRALALTARQRDVAELAATGLTNRDIAARLSITERTVEVHLTNAFRKLAVRSRSALAQIVLRKGRRQP